MQATHDTFDPMQLMRADQTKLINGLVVPRPIAWVSTIGAAGVNLAPFSYFNIVAVDPMTVMFSCSIPLADRAGTTKDTLQNIEEVPEFVLHLVDKILADAMNVTSAEFPRGQDEFAAAGLTALPSQRVRPPRIVEASVQMECRVSNAIKLGRVPYTMVLGEVVALHTRKGLVNDRFHVDQEAHRPIARLGGASQYATTQDRFVISGSNIKTN